MQTAICFQAEDKLKKSRATAVIDDYTKIRFMKTKDPVLDGDVLSAKLPDNGKVAEVQKEMQD